MGDGRKEATGDTFIERATAFIGAVAGKVEEAIIPAGTWGCEKVSMEADYKADRVVVDIRFALDINEFRRYLSQPGPQGADTP
jgi:hypothetical protein